MLSTENIYDPIFDYLNKIDNLDPSKLQALLEQQCAIFIDHTKEPFIHLELKGITQAFPRSQFYTSTQFYNGILGNAFKYHCLEKLQPLHFSRFSSFNSVSFTATIEKYCKAYKEITLIAQSKNISLLTQYTNEYNTRTLETFILEQATIALGRELTPLISYHDDKIEKTDLNYAIDLIKKINTPSPYLQQLMVNLIAFKHVMEIDTENFLQNKALILFLIKQTNRVVDIVLDSKVDSATKCHVIQCYEKNMLVHQHVFPARYSKKIRIPIGLIVGVIVGALIGFVVCGIPGALIGAGAGALVGTLCLMKWRPSYTGPVSISLTEVVQNKEISFSTIRKAIA